MRRTRSIPSLTLAVILAGALAQTGCIQDDTKTTLKADGSGTISDSMTIELQKIKDLMEMGKAFGGGGGGPGGPGGAPEVPDMDIEKGMDQAFSEDELKKQLKDIPGVEVKSVKSEKKDGKRIVTSDISFTDFSVLGKAHGQFAADLAKNADGTWTLTYDATGGQGAALSGGGEAGGMEEGMPAGMDMSAMMGMFEPYVGTLEFKRSVTLPSEIVETNGTKSEDGKTVSWKLGFKEMMAPGKDGKSGGLMTVKFKGEGVTLKPFSYKPDPKEAMKKFEAPASKPAATKPGGAVPEAPVSPKPEGPEAPVSPKPEGPEAPESPKPEEPKAPEVK